MKDDGGKIVYTDYSFDVECGDFAGVMHHLRKVSAGRMYGEYVPAHDNTYYDEKREEELFNEA